MLQMSPNEKLFYIYLITNEKAKPSGIYKFFISDCIFRTGLKQKQIEVIMKKFQQAQLAISFPPWIFVTRFLEETFNLNKKILSPKIKIAIENRFKQEKVPIKVIGCFHSFYDTLSIQYPYNMDTILDFRLEILDLRLKTGYLSSSTSKDDKSKINYNYKTNEFENINEGQIKRWQKAYLAVNINQEILRSGAWLESNPKNRKSDFKRFINKWLVKAQDRAPTTNQHPPKQTARERTMAKLEKALDEE